MIFKTIKMQKYINFFINKFCKNYSFYEKNLDLNLEISQLILEISTQIDIPKKEYITQFDEISTIQLASEILNSISPELRERYLTDIKNKKIIFSKTASFSYTCCDNNIQSVILKSNNLTQVISSLHEFFHFLHLEKVDKDLSNENYYCYTEILGMTADFYSVIYLLNTHKELLDDIKAYMSEYYHIFISLANSTFIDGILISIYKENNSLSKASIKRYVREHKLSEDYTNIMEYKDVACLDYYEEVRYIYSLPVALILSNLLSFDEEFNFIDFLEKLDSHNFDECLSVSGLSKYIYDKKKLYEVMKYYRQQIYDLFNNEETKVKRMGAL